MRPSVMIFAYLCILFALSNGQSIEEDAKQMFEAYKHVERGEFTQAAASLRRAMQVFPYKDKLAADYGQVLFKKSSLEEDFAKGGQEASIREACAAIQLGELLGDSRAAPLTPKCLQSIYAPNETSWQTLVQSVQAAREVRETGMHSAAALCGNDGMVLHIPEDFLGELSMEMLLKAYTSMVICGAVALNGSVFEHDFVSILAQEQERVLNAYLAHRQAGEIAEANGGAEAKDKHTFARQRGKSRFEVKAPIAPPFNDDRLVANPVVLMIVRLLLGSRVEIDTLSQVTALPGAEDQNWHTDVEPLFLEPASTDYHPPVGLVMVVPLRNLTQDMGPTEFQMGSHRSKGAKQDSMEAQMEQLLLPVSRPTLAAGSVVLFDLRLKHRGTQNRAEAMRPILYVSYVKEWFYDVRNFQAAQSDAFDDMSALRKKLLKRLDHNNYVEELSEFAEGKKEEPPKQCAAFQVNNLRI